MTTRANLFFLTIFITAGRIRTCVHSSPEQLGFIAPSPGFMFPESPANIGDSPRVHSGFTDSIFRPRKLETSLAPRNLKVHVDFGSLESLSVDKRVYIESKDPDSQPF